MNINCGICMQIQSIHTVLFLCIIVYYCVSLCASFILYFNIVLLWCYSTALRQAFRTYIEFWLTDWTCKCLHTAYTCTHICIYTCTHTRAHTHTQALYAHAHTHMHAHMCMYAWACTHTHTPHTHIHTHTWAHTHTHACTHTHTHTWAHTHTCMHARTHTHTHMTGLKLTKRLEMFSWLLEVLCNSLFQPTVGFIQNVLCHCGIGVGDCVAPCQPWLNCRHLLHNVMSASVSVIASTCQKRISCQHHC